MEFRKNSFNDEDSATLAQVATLYQNVADDAISASDSASIIISQMKAFNIPAENAIHIIDAINAVSNNFAVSSTDVATALSKTSSAMGVLGNDFESTIGLVVAGTEIMTGQATKVSRGLRTIGNNFAKAANDAGEIEYKVGGATKSLSLMDETTGDMKSTFQIFKDLKSDWDNMSSSEQQSIALAYAGKNQFEVFGAVMNNFQAAIDAANTAYDSQKSAMDENASYMESIEAKLQNLKAAYENFASNTITKEFIGSILDAGTKLLEFANTDMGQAVAKAVLFGGAITGVTGIAGEFISKIIGIASSVKKATGGVEAFLGMAAGGKWTVIALAIGAVAAAIILIVDAIKNADSKFDKFMGEFDKSKQKTEEYQQSLDDTKKKLDELNNTPYADRTSEQQHEIEVLQDQIEYYQQLIDLEKQRQTEAAIGAYQEAIKGGVKMGTKVHGADRSIYGQYLQYGDRDRFKGFDLTAEEIARFDALDALPSKFSSVQAAAEAYAKALGLSWVNADGTIKSVEDMQNELEDFGIVIDDVVADLETSSSAFQELADNISKGAKPTQEQLNLAKSYIESNKQIADGLQARLENGDKLSDAESQWLSNYNNLLNAYKEGQDALDKYNKSVETADKALASFPDHMKNSSSAIGEVAKALVNNSELGITSVKGLKTALLDLAAGDAIDLSKIGNIDDFIAKLVEAEGIKFSDKNINVETNAEEAKNQIEAVNDSVEDQSMDVHISTVAEGHELEGALQNIADWIDKINGKTVKVTLEADVSAAKEQINSVTNDINNIVAGVDVTITTNAPEARAQIQDVQSAADALSNVKPKVTVKANITSALTNLNTIKNYTIPDKYFSVVCSGASVAIQNLATIKRGLDQLHDKTVTVTVNYKKTGKYATGTKSAPGGLALINDGAPVNGSAGELVVHDGVGQIYNDGKETVQPIPKGAKIYTARQTQGILKDRGLTVDDVAENPIPAMANGTKNNPKYPDRRNDPTYSGVTTLYGSGEDLKKNFEEWLKEKKHWLNMDVISEAQYYRDLEIMNERYLKNLSDAKDEYWQHEEEIYKYQNQSLEDQIRLEEKLSDLAKAKENRVYALSGGRFQYLQNLDAIAKAQREVDQLTGKYANGTTNARGGLSLVGENGPEMRVLGHGDGIIPAEATKNLMALSSLNIKDALSNIGRAIVTNYSFDISRLELPSVSNAGEFLDGLKNLAYQYSYARA